MMIKFDDKEQTIGTATNDELSNGKGEDDE